MTPLSDKPSLIVIITPEMERCAVAAQMPVERWVAEVLAVRAATTIDALQRDDRRWLLRRAAANAAETGERRKARARERAGR